MNIRPETPRDYAAIGDLHVRAFGRPEEALIIPLLRQRQLFDPELSLVAEIDGNIVGHVLFSPYVIRLLEQDVNAVNLAPIAVDPQHQGKGIGKALIYQGHEAARHNSYTLSFLLGHVEYYPHFGYKTGVYGVSSVDLAYPHLNKSDLSERQLTTRSPIEADIPTLRQLWLHEETHVDFAIDPGQSLLDWISPNPNITVSVYVHDDVVVGYSRVHKDESAKPRVFLATDHKTALAMAKKLLERHPWLTLPLHPYSQSAAAFDIKPQVTPWNAAMACSLAPNPFDDYYAQLQAGTRLPGRVIWPVAFDLA